MKLLGAAFDLRQHAQEMNEHRAERPCEIRRFVGSIDMYGVGEISATDQGCGGGELLDAADHEPGDEPSASEPDR